MMRLLIVEARRALARGVTRLLLVIAFVGLGATMIGVFVATKDADTIRADMEAAKARALAPGQAYGSRPLDRETAVKECVDAMSRRSAGAVPVSTTVVTGPGSGGSLPSVTAAPTVPRDPNDWSDVDSGNGTPERIQAYCETQARSVYPSGPSSSTQSNQSTATPDYYSYYYGPKIFDYTTNLWKDKGEGSLLAPASLLFFGALIAGASLIGSEWQTGSFVMFLTWEPRRVRIFLAKAGTYALLAFGFAMVLLVLFALALYPTAAIKGTTDGINGEWLQSLVTAMVRMSLIAAFAAALGSSLAMLGRRTALALIGVFAYLFIIEGLVGGFVESIRPWLLAINLATFMSGAEITVGRGDSAFTRTTATAGFTLLAYTLVFVVLAAAAFRRRDFASG